MGGVILLAIDPRGSYYMITVYQWYNSKMYLKRKHFPHWLCWWCQNWNWIPVSRINEFFNSGSNYNMLIYDSYPYNIPIIRKNFLSWVRWWPSLCNLTPWWGLITCLTPKIFTCVFKWSSRFRETDKSSFKPVFPVKNRWVTEFIFSPKISANLQQQGAKIRFIIAQDCYQQ